MLNHIVIGPDRQGMYLTAYERSHLEKVAVLECRTKEQATEEAERLNREQILREEAIQRDRILCGFHRVVTDLEIV